MTQNSGLQRFVELNLRKWGPMTPGDGSALININGIPQQTVIAGIAGRMLHEQKGVTPIVLLSPSTKRHEDVRQVLGSFGITRFLRLSRNPITHPVALARTFLLSRRARKMIRSHGLEHFVDNFTVDGVHLGDLIYDSLIRYQHSYRDPLADPAKLSRILFNSLWLFCCCQHFLRVNRVKYVIISESVYAITEGLLLRAAARQGAKVLFVNASFARFYADYKDTFCDRFKVTTPLFEASRRHANRLEVAEAYLARRNQGALAHHDVINAYKGKKVWTREDLMSHFKITDRAGLRSVFLMPHCFSDANHKTRHVLFRDFYQWFSMTLEAIRGIREVNWFVKPHPSGHHYGEEGQAEELVRKVASDHIFLIPPDFSTTSVLNNADAIVTVNGTIGLEASCAGVRPILAGDAVYSGFGFTTQPKSREDYFTLLRNLHTMPPLTEQEVRTAKEVLFCFQFFTRPQSRIVPAGTIRPGCPAEEFERMYSGYYNTMAENMAASDIRQDPYMVSLARLIQAEAGSIEQWDPIPVP